MVISPMLLFRELLGLAQVTVLKKQRSWSYRRVTSRPRKILATKLPPGRSTWSVIFRACVLEGQVSARGLWALPQETEETDPRTDRQQELSLHELVEVVETCHVGCTVTDYEVRPSPLEVRDNLFCRAGFRDVSLDLDHSR